MQRAVPESPRWLIRHDRAAEALTILKSVHSSKGGDDSIAIREYTQICSQAEADQQAMREHGKWQLITQGTYRKRLIIAFAVILAVQSVGFLVVLSKCHELDAIFIGT